MGGDDGFIRRSQSRNDFQHLVFAAELKVAIPRELAAVSRFFPCEPGRVSWKDIREEDV
jgi:hypothetical protein